jgi:hypothetical protein
MNRIWYVIFSGTLVAACSDEEETSTFARVESQIFAHSCTTESCHDVADPAAGLVLASGYAHDALVDAAVTNAPASQRGMLRVASGDPSRSFLLAKLTNALEQGEGSPMPRSAGLLDESSIDILRAWIEAGAPEEGLVEGDDGRELNVGGRDGRVQLEQPARGVQLKVKSRPLASGTEETLCHYLKLPSDEGFDVTRIEVAVSGGSHHIHLYRPYSPKLVKDGFEECNAAVNFDEWELLVVTQLPYVDWKLPEGVAIELHPGEQLLMQTHFVNIGLLETSGEGEVLMNLHAAEPGTITAHAGSLFGQNRDVLVPPQTTLTASSMCIFPKPVTMIAQSGHYHFRGRRFSTYRWNGARGEELYHHEGYDDPFFLAQGLGEAPVFSAGEALEWECEWVNGTDATYEFGPYTDVNEHCNLFGFYYPTEAGDESITCVRKDGVDETTVRRTHTM